MAQNIKISINEDWVLVTDSNVSTITFQVTGERSLQVLGTNGTTEPGSSSGGLVYGAGQGERNTALSDLFPGVSGVNRLWMRMVSYETEVFVSHA